MAQQFHNVTAEQIAYVAQLQRAGDEAAALQAANDAATSGFNEQTKSLRDNMGTIESSADSLKRAFKSMWDAALDIGRPDTAQEMVAKAEAAFKKADEIWNLRKGDHVNDEARARFWNDRKRPGWRWIWRSSRRALPKRTKRMHRAKRLRNLTAKVRRAGPGQLRQNTKCPGKVHGPPE
jgi:phage-related minor tail protein